MRLRQIEANEFKEKIYTRYKKDFPRKERMYYFQILRAVSQNKMKIIVLEENDILGYAILMHKDGYELIYYIAIFEEVRSKGYGSQFLQLIKKEFSTCKAIYIEVERQGYGKNEIENEIRRKRIEFYHKNGFENTDVSIYLYGVDYEILAIPMEESIIEIKQKVAQIEIGIIKELWGDKAVQKFLKIV